MGTDPKLYPVIMMHAAIGGTFGPPVEMLIKFIPGIGEADMLLEGILGRGLITGRKLGTGERALNIFFGLLPVAGGLLSGGKAGAKAMANVVEATHIEPERLVAMLESAEHLDPRITAIVKKALNGATLTAEERNELLALRRTLAESGMVRRAGGEVEAITGGESTSIAGKGEPTVRVDEPTTAAAGRQPTEISPRVTKALSRGERATARIARAQAARADLDAALKALGKTIGGRLSANPFLDPEVWKATLDVAKKAVRAGITDFQAFLARLRASEALRGINFDALSQEENVMLERAFQKEVGSTAHATEAPVTSGTTLTHSQLRHLAFDPDVGRVTSQAVSEVETAVAAERSGMLGPVTGRGSRGADLVAGETQLSVKRPFPHVLSDIRSRGKILAALRDPTMKLLLDIRQVTDGEIAEFLRLADELGIPRNRIIIPTRSAFPTLGGG